MSYFILTYTTSQYSAQHSQFLLSLSFMPWYRLIACSVFTATTFEGLTHRSFSNRFIIYCLFNCFLIFHSVNLVHPALSSALICSFIFKSYNLLLTLKTSLHMLVYWPFFFPCYRFTNISTDM